MIAYLEGLLAFKEPTNVIIDVHGVGYSVNISLQTYATLPGGGDRVKLFIHHLFREDSQSLYGFASADEKSLFLDLIGVSGVGPNTALGMLSAMQPADLRLAILGENVRAVQAIKGIGAKTAQRIILELRDKMKRAGVVPDGPSYRQQPANNPVREESLAALVALGFPKLTAEKSVDDALRADPNLTVEDVIRQALR
ncbi:Holliday junction branch migration protein RuvA [Spirosoma montaniterrae]|uniref:Holliday junction branch migration complex subunit RuvA n=1 Tax=Spirosoma montaniterrae TaxID=1178516 RepID=A0A1P9X3P4_9BACT|nr:Holliday junction branch migration protein RuvA [Spirosoma montaniterrae]AQG82203.1 Holliday junction ATP-dependent DNA helicase RuvA [Spirosoma montaniterrae]